jgi:hypothetical protein
LIRTVLEPAQAAGLKHLDCPELVTLTCSPGSQAIAAVALALMVMEWSMVISVDIALFICSLTIC